MWQAAMADVDQMGATDEDTMDILILVHEIVHLARVTATAAVIESGPQSAP